MPEQNPLDTNKNQYQSIINKIKSDSAVGIDAQYTHAVIIDYLERLTVRVEKIEQLLKKIS